MTLRDGEGGGRGAQDGEHMYTHGWFMSMYGKNHYNIVISLQLNKLKKKIILQCRRPEFYPWVGKIPCSREQIPTAVFWPGEFQGLCKSMGSQRVGHDWVTFTVHFVCCRQFPKQGVELRFPTPEPVAPKDIKSVSSFVTCAWVHSTYQIQRLHTKNVHSMNTRLGKI